MRSPTQLATVQRTKSKSTAKIWVTMSKDVSYFECASVFNFDDIHTLEEAFTNCFRSYLLRTLFGNYCCLECCVQRAQESRRKEGKKAWNVGFIFSPPTRYIQYFDVGLNRSFSALLARNLHSFVPKHKWNYHQMHHVGRDELAHARWKSRRLLAVVSLSFA